MSNAIQHKVETYYSDKIKTYGASPQGVDWNSEESQHTRFEQLCKILPNTAYSILDFGCGYGSLLPYLQQKNKQINYTGLDLSEAMLLEARNKHSSKTAKWITELPENQQWDYSIASGIFNVKLDVPTNDWEQYIATTLDTLDKHSSKGFSFNILTAYSDKEYMKEYLYYAQPEYYFEVCKKKYSKNIALLHDYNLYEFTILVRK